MTPDTTAGYPSFARTVGGMAYQIEGSDLKESIEAGKPDEPFSSCGQGIAHAFMAKRRERRGGCSGDRSSQTIRSDLAW